MVTPFGTILLGVRGFQKVPDRQLAHSGEHLCQQLANAYG
jgi:hypothetical protein